MKIYYLYEIKIDNSESSLNGCFYYGKHEIDSEVKDNYFGSGMIIKRYQAVYGTYGLTKTILSYHENSEQLCEAELNLVRTKKLELGDRCLNLAEGGHGSWAYINSVATPEQKHANALAGGLGNKKRLEDPTKLALYKQKCRAVHASRSIEQKEACYTKVSSSLKNYYNSELGRAEYEKRKLANIETNKKVSKE